MKIGINGRFLTHRITGVERVAHNLLTNLLKFDNENEYFLYSPIDNIDEKWDRYPNLKTVKSGIKSTTKGKLHLWEQKTLPKLTEQYGNSVLYNPINTAPLKQNIPFVLHLHGIEYKLLPQAYSRSFRLYYNFLIPRISESAAMIITVSNSSKRDIIKHLKLPMDKVKVIYNGVDDAFFRDESERETARSPITEPYILFVGSTSPVKNVSTLIEAYKIYLERTTENPLKLAIVGCSNENFRDSEINISSIKRMVILPGYAETSDLVNYYHHARIFVFPSLYEAFGLPPLEAMAAGVPVIASNSSSLPEIIGDAGLLVEPKDANSIAQKITKLSTNDILYNELRRKGIERAREFSWEKSAIKLLQTFKEI
ncbi:glycosyltransferase family 4 protein [bacterium]|nr:glycosyltransferase family 4 protein [bacterium]